jgi:lipid-binding SYLF domain-containing protein
MTRCSRAAAAVHACLWLLIVLGVPGVHASPERDRERAEAQLDRVSVHFEALQSDPARSVPPEILRDALGVVVVRETRAGFILGGKGGRGAMVLRDGAGWTAPVFVRTREGGVGLQAGWQNATFIQVLMSAAAVDAVRTNQFRFGVGLRVTSGPRTLGDEAKTKSRGADVLLYADTGGLYGGLALEGGSLRPDEGWNRDLYGMEADAVLFGVRPGASPAGRRLVALLERFSGDPK